MAKLVFPMPEVRVLIEHAKSSKEHRLTMVERFDIFGEEKGFNYQEGEEKRGSPGLWLVKDHGIYVMSNGFPGLCTEETKDAPEGEQKMSVCYAKGYNPNKDSDVWQKCSFAVGGDDFVEKIDISMVEQFLNEPVNEMIIDITPKQFSISCR